MPQMFERDPKHLQIARSCTNTCAVRQDARRVTSRTPADAADKHSLDQQYCVRIRTLNGHVPNERDHPSFSRARIAGCFWLIRTSEAYQQAGLQYAMQQHYGRQSSADPRLLTRYGGMGAF